MSPIGDLRIKGTVTVVAASLPRVKKRILNMNLATISGRARRMTSEPDPERLKAMVDVVHHAG